MIFHVSGKIQTKFMLYNGSKSIVQNNMTFIFGATYNLLPYNAYLKNNYNLRMEKILMAMFGVGVLHTL